MPVSIVTIAERSVSCDVVFELESHGPDTYVGAGPRYPWGGLYGGQVVAQALAAAARSVDDGFEPHSIRAYFIRRGDHAEPVRYEVDRIRNGRSFTTRRVVARQAIGAILNAECSFQRPEEAAAVQTVPMPAVPGPDELESASWTTAFDRRWVPDAAVAAGERTGAGRAVAWLRVAGELGDPDDTATQLLHRCWLAYLSDDLPTDAVIRAHPAGPTIAQPSGESATFSASLDHTIWYHRRLRADRWHLHDFTCHHFVGGRGLALGHVFSDDGTHVATVAQEVLVRFRGDRG
jgi:acyl-CoA thioesterase-2